MDLENIYQEIKEIKQRLKALERPQVPMTEEDSKYFAPETQLNDTALKLEALLATLRLHVPEFYQKYDEVYTKLQSGETATLDAPAD